MLFCLKWHLLQIWCKIDFIITFVAFFFKRKLVGHKCMFINYSSVIYYSVIHLPQVECEVYVCFYKTNKT